MILYKYMKTAQMSLRGQTNGGIFYLLPKILVRLLSLLPLMFLWRILAGSGVEVGMTLPQRLSYTYMNGLLAELLVVQTVASSWSYEGKLIGLFSRPMSVFGQLIADTMGGWLPMLLLFTAPMLLLAPALGISVIPQTLWFFPSLLLCISLGFAMEFFFVCVTIRFGGMAWLAQAIREALLVLFSGTLVPFKLLPFGLTKFFEYQPFGSLGGAPLSLLAGTAEPLQILLTQVFWNVVVWVVAVWWFKHSQERMVSFGG